MSPSGKTLFLVWGHHRFLFSHREINSFISWYNVQDACKHAHWNWIMGMCQQIAYSQYATKPVQNTAAWYATNQTLHDNLKVPFIKDVIQEKSINHHDKLGDHSNPILQPLLEQQQTRRLRKLWRADLTDDWRGFTHWRGPHHDTVSTGGRCLTQHKP
jgi:hypothetical protein